MHVQLIDEHSVALKLRWCFNILMLCAHEIVLRKNKVQIIMLTSGLSSALAIISKHPATSASILKAVAEGEDTYY